MRAGSVLLAVGGGGLAVSGALLRAARSFAAADPATVDSLVGTAACVAALAVTGWCTVALVVAVLRTLAGLAGATGPAAPAGSTAGDRHRSTAGDRHRRPHRLDSPVARRVAAGLLGVGLAAASAVPATAAGTAPSLDRPAAHGQDRQHPQRWHRPRAGDVVRVRPGDSLWAIAAEHLGPGHSDADVAAAWPLWHRANRAEIGADPDRLVPGQALHPPTSRAGRATPPSPRTGPEETR